LNFLVPITTLCRALSSFYHFFFGRPPYTLPSGGSIGNVWGLFVSTIIIVSAPTV
jgi:hypothetical protein